MSFIARVGPEAGQDIDDEAAYYEGEQPGLGVQFVVEVFDKIDAATGFPSKHREEFDDVRVALVDGFPFGVFFIIEGVEVVVLAVLDLRRDVRRRLETLRQRLLRERSRP